MPARNAAVDHGASVGWPLVAEAGRGAACQARTVAVTSRDGLDPWANRPTAVPFPIGFRSAGDLDRRGAQTIKTTNARPSRISHPHPTVLASLRSSKKTQKISAIKLAHSLEMKSFLFAACMFLLAAVALGQTAQTVDVSPNAAYAGNAVGSFVGTGCVMLFARCESESAHQRALVSQARPPSRPPPPPPHRQVRQSSFRCSESMLDLTRCRAMWSSCSYRYHHCGRYVDKSRLAHWSHLTPTPGLNNTGATSAVTQVTVRASRPLVTRSGLDSPCALLQPVAATTPVTTVKVSVRWRRPL